MKELTRAEEQIMKILWKIHEGVIHDILEHFKEPKPAYNTVSTIVRILQKKNFIDHRSVGKTHIYFPTISEENYANQYLKGFMGKYFSNSFKKMASFFTDKNNMSIEELEQLKKLINEKIEKQKQ
jgi:predicted transcriptional regulator